MQGSGFGAAAKDLGCGIEDAKFGLLALRVWV
jgi:hypothetical protein